MKGKLISVTLIFSFVMVILSVGFYISSKGTDYQDKKSEYIIALNEIAQLNNNKKYEEMQEKITALQQDMRDAGQQENIRISIPVLCTVSVLFFFLAFGYIYLAVVRPFDKMKDFAARISAGDFTVPLRYQRTNYFGEFTWAFDSMRNEITKLRADEKEAIENNKTVIATLSHDIKTPISSIRAYIEALAANMGSSYEERERYFRVIMKKCDEVSKLTDDLFLHSISDLDKLAVASERIELCSFMELAVKEIAARQNDLRFEKTDFTAYVNADRNRLMQIAENLINNARKYAKTDIRIFFTKDDSHIALHFRDYGSGIPDENMPFVFDKFYRGNNCGGEQGSGLGLYIVKYITQKMGGTVTLANHRNGLEAVVCLPLCRQ